MKKIALLISLLFLFTPTLLHAKHKKKCQVSGGKVTGCYGGPYYGELPIAYNPNTAKFEKKCQVSAGKVTGCYGGPFYGELPIAYDPNG